MKPLFTILFFCFSLSVSAQSLYPGNNTKRSSLYDSGNHSAIKTVTTTTKQSSLYPESEQTENVVASQNTEAFAVRVERTLYGINFNQNGSKLTEALRQKIETYLSNTTHRQFKNIGVFTIDVVKRNGNYFVAIDDSFNHLEAL